MASRKNLKKDVDYLCDGLKFEVLCSTLQPGIEETVFTELLTRVDRLNEDFRSRIQHSTGNECKSYYKKLREDFTTEADKIYAELKMLNTEKSAN